jgi:serine/threonine-protein kinase
MVAARGAGMQLVTDGGETAPVHTGPTTPGPTRLAETVALAPLPRPRRASSPTLSTERYEVNEPIGRGGMGEVLAAHDVQIGREVAVKRMNAEQPTAEQLARFLREARIQGRLEHPAIPPVHEIAYDDEGKPFFVMRKLEGTTLADILRAPRAEYSRIRLLRAFVEVCNAIELAHSWRIIHRDLKPANILLGELGEVYVLDWGIARELDAVDASTTTLGTPGYMPPEQSRGDRDLDQRVDIYALGCVLFEILTGMRRHRAGEHSPPSAHAVDIPPELDELCLLATHPEREQRLGSVKILGEGVRRYVDGDRDLARRRELAKAHLAAAHGAMARIEHDEEARRRNAIREAGRALALDPTLTEAADLVGHLMLAVPRELPAPVARELGVLDDTISQQQAKFARAIALGFLGGTPVFYALGLHDATYLGLFAACTTLMFVFAQIGTVRGMRMFSGCTIVATMLVIAMFSRMFSPFLIAPGIGAVALSAIALHPISRSKRAIITITLLTLLAVLLPWVAEAVGVLSPTIHKSGLDLHITSPMTGTELFPSVPALIFYVVTLLGIAAAIAHANAIAIHSSRRQVHVQAWHLRQLL